jgi:hypothetical protein
LLLLAVVEVVEIKLVVAVQVDCVHLLLLQVVVVL